MLDLTNTEKKFLLEAHASSYETNSFDPLTVGRLIKVARGEAELITKKLLKRGLIENVDGGYRLTERGFKLVALVGPKPRLWPLLSSESKPISALLEFLRKFWS